MEQWSEGVFLLGRYNDLLTGCWLLTNGQQGAILELPPYNPAQGSPAVIAQRVAEELGIEITYLLCSHDHGDHFATTTAEEFRRAFPQATLCLHRDFRSVNGTSTGVRTFDESLTLALDGEPLLLVHAPKHSWTDTMILFRGVAFTGDWELNTIRSVHRSVPDERKQQSIATMIAFVEQHQYDIHKVFSVHANDRREEVDFVELMHDTTIDRQLW